MIYEYACDACGAELECEARMGQAPRWVRCDCGQRAMKVISLTAVRPDLDTFSDENNGRGRWNPQLNQFVKSTQDTLDKAKAQGLRPYG